MSIVRYKLHIHTYTYLDIGRCNVLYEVVQDGSAIASAHSQVAEKLTHQLDVGDVREKDGEVAGGKGHGILRPLRRKINHLLQYRTIILLFYILKVFCCPSILWQDNVISAVLPGYH